jgi:hypothetical protein
VLRRAPDFSRRVEELYEKASASAKPLRSSEELLRDLELFRLSRKHAAVFSFRFCGPEDPFPPSENSTSRLYKARRLTALPWGSFPFGVFKRNQRPTPSLPHSAVLRLQVFSTS